MPVKETEMSRLTLSTEHPGEWHVTADGTKIVGFSGRDAHELAERQLRELSELMDGDSRRGVRDSDGPAQLFPSDR